MFKKSVFFGWLLLACPVYAGTGDGMFASMQSVLQHVWCRGTYHLLVPINTWHNRLTYDRHKIDEYNERPWGLGIAKSYVDNRFNRHSLFAMGFMDSHDDLEPIAGYQFSALWALDKAKNWRVSLGGILGVTMRSDYDYVPFPVPLPVIGFEYKRFLVESAYVPGFGKNTGNVLFTWLRWQF